MTYNGGNAFLNPCVPICGQASNWLYECLQTKCHLRNQKTIFQKLEIDFGGLGKPSITPSSRKHSEGFLYTKFVPKHKAYVEVLWVCT
jgi:hypothetical protein